MMAYRECLKKANEFMEASGLRALCVEVCRGQCCLGAWEKERCRSLLSCHDKLPCVGYLCQGIREYLQRMVPATRGFLFRWSDDIGHIIYKRVDGNVYFTPYSLAKMRGLRFPDMFDPAPLTLMKIKEAVEALRAETQSLEPRDQAGRKLFANGRSRINEALHRMKERE